MSSLSFEESKKLLKSIEAAPKKERVTDPLFSETITKEQSIADIKAWANNQQSKTKNHGK